MVAYFRPLLSSLIWWLGGRLWRRGLWVWILIITKLRTYQHLKRLQQFYLSTLAIKKIGCIFLTFGEILSRWLFIGTRMMSKNTARPRWSWNNKKLLGHRHNLRVSQPSTLQLCYWCPQAESVCLYKKKKKLAPQNIIKTREAESLPKHVREYRHFKCDFLWFWHIIIAITAAALPCMSAWCQIPCGRNPKPDVDVLHFRLYSWFLHGEIKTQSRTNLGALGTSKASRYY